MQWPPDMHSVCLCLHVLVVHGEAGRRAGRGAFGLACGRFGRARSQLSAGNFFCTAPPPIRVAPFQMTTIGSISGKVRKAVTAYWFIRFRKKPFLPKVFR